MIDVAYAAVHLVTDAANALAAMVPDPDPSPPPGAGKFKTILNWVAWIAGLVLVGFGIVAGIRIGSAYKHGREVPDGVAALGWVCVAAVVVGSASTFVTLMM